MNLFKGNKDNPRKHDYTAPRGTYEREKQTQKRPKNLHLQRYNLNETPYYTTLQANESDTNTPKHSTSKHKPTQTPKAALWIFAKVGRMPIV